MCIGNLDSTKTNFTIHMQTCNYLQNKNMHAKINPYYNFIEQLQKYHFAFQHFDFQLKWLSVLISLHDIIDLLI